MIFKGYAMSDIRQMPLLQPMTPEDLNPHTPLRDSFTLFQQHLIKLGKRREVAVMVGDVPGASKLGDAGFKLIPLEPLEAVGFALADALVQIIAVVVRPTMREAYSMVTRDHGKLVAVYAPARESDVDDIIRNIDKLLVE